MFPGPPGQPSAPLAEPLDTPYSPAELAKRDGSDPSMPTWVAVKGIIFDVTDSEHYRHGSRYGAAFAGKDASRALAKSSLNPEDCIAKYDDLPAEELAVLDQWVNRFKAKYNVVGRVQN